jgi:hypothetical protein
VAFIKANPGRVNSYHLKEWSDDPQVGYKALLGEGVGPWTEIFAAAESVGGAEHYLIEQEGSRLPPLETPERHDGGDYAGNLEWSEAHESSVTTPSGLSAPSALPPLEDRAADAEGSRDAKEKRHRFPIRSERPANASRREKRRSELHELARRVRARRLGHPEA